MPGEQSILDNLSEINHTNHGLAHPIIPLVLNFILDVAFQSLSEGMDLRVSH